MQKAEEKKSAGPKAARNHQQRLENIVKQTTVETKVRHSNTQTLEGCEILHTSFCVILIMIHYLNLNAL